MCTNFEIASVIFEIGVDYSWPLLLLARDTGTLGLLSEVRDTSMCCWLSFHGLDKPIRLRITKLLYACCIFFYYSLGYALLETQ